MLCRSLLVFMAMSPAVSVAADVEHRFLRLFEPNESDKYATTSTIATVGYVYFLDNAWRPEDLRIRVQIYIPANGDFELFQEDDAEIGQPLQGDPATLQFHITVKPKQVPKAGKYLLRVDCFDKTGQEEKLLASNSAFLTFVETRKNKPEVQASTSRPARTYHALRIERRPRWRSRSD